MKKSFCFTAMPQKEMSRGLSVCSIPTMDLNQIRSASAKLIAATGVSQICWARAVRIVKGRFRGCIEDLVGSESLESLDFARRRWLFHPDNPKKRQGRRRPCYHINRRRKSPFCQLIRSLGGSRFKPAGARARLVNPDGDGVAVLVLFSSSEF